MVTLTGVENTPPYLLLQRFNLVQTVRINSFTKFELPVQDYEESKVTSSLSPSQTFVEVDPNLNVLMISPSKAKYLGTSTFILSLFDGNLTSNYTLKVIVTNSAPVFTMSKPKD